MPRRRRQPDPHQKYLDALFLEFNSLRDRDDLTPEETKRMQLKWVAWVEGQPMRLPRCPYPTGQPDDQTT